MSKGRWTSKDGESSRSVWIVHRLQSNPWPFLFSDNIALASSLYTRASMSHCAWRSHLVFFAARRCIAFRRAKICIRKEESVGEGFVFRSHRIRRTFVIRHRHSRLLELNFASTQGISFRRARVEHQACIFEISFYVYFVRYSLFP